MDIAVIVLAYFLGSVPFGLLISRYAGLGDIRTQGSGNIGATNVLRVGSKKLGALTLLADGAKGAAAVLVAVHFSGVELVVLSSAALAVLGHMFPLWLRFRGGKGVATTFGVLLALHFPLGVLALVIWLGTFLLTRISSLSAIFSMVATPSIAFYMVEDSGYSTAYLCLFLALVVIMKHHANIRRLLHGEESRITRQGKGGQAQ